MRLGFLKVVRDGKDAISDGNFLGCELISQCVVVAVMPSI